VKEGEQVTLLSKDDPWIRVEFNGVEGWKSQSSVTDDPKVVLSSQAVASGVRATEQSAAGRGFNPTVEREYRKRNPSLESAFHLLDKIEKENAELRAELPQPAQLIIDVALKNVRAVGWQKSARGRAVIAP